MPRVVSAKDSKRARPSRTTLTRWLLRMLLHGGVLDELEDAGRWPNGDIARALGLGREGRRTKHSSRRLERWLDPLEESPPVREEPLATNVERLGDKLGLSSLERDLLMFASVMQVEDALGVCLGRGSGGSRLGVDRICKRIALALGSTGAEVRGALRPGSVLYSSRLVRLDEAGTSWYQPVLQTVEPLTPLLFLEHENIDTLLAAFFRQAEGAAHGLDAFPHLADDLALALPVLRGGLAARSAGVNVLLHGPAGAGKTELARAMAREIGASLYEVHIADDDGDPTTAHARLAAYALCQRVLAHARASMVLFDEIEDVFARDSAWSCEQGTVTGSHKGWLTRTLERNPVPAVWVSNEIGHIDPAILRRFDLVIPVRSPPERVRASVLERHAGDLPVRSAWIHKVARDDRLRPGHVQRACRVARTLDLADPENLEKALDRLLDRAVTAEGLQRRVQNPHTDACAYTLDLLNTDLDASALVAGLARRRRGTACLYGPPGTGKTAFAAHCADRLGMPLVVRKASDLVSHWVGQTEKNLAEMFASAGDDGAFLVLDEADSFLQDRRRAEHSWQISEVNELLVQMEQFTGIFFTATNLIESLDPAALRRFDAKVRFDPLRLDQRWHMLEATLRTLAPDRMTAVDGASSVEARRRLAGLHGITPGDFAAVARRTRLLGLEASLDALLAGLEGESSLKPGGSRRAIGLSASRLAT